MLTAPQPPCPLHTHTAAHLRFLVTGGLAVGDAPHPNPAPDWVSAKMWGEACRTEALGPQREGLPQQIAGQGHVFSTLAAWLAA